MSNHATEVLVGAAVIAVAAGFMVYAGQVTGFGGGNGGAPSYTAAFRSVEGISVGTDVKLGGVKVGTVTGLALNPTTFRAETTFTVTEDLALPSDSAITVASEGLLGGSFLELQPGGAPDNLEPGGEILDTQSAVSIVDLMVKFAAGGDGTTE